mgnify:CR=1 FL=1
MDEHNADAYVVEEYRVPDRILQHHRIDHRVAAELDYDRPAMELLEVGERLHEHIFAFHYVVYLPLIST